MNDRMWGLLFWLIPIMVINTQIIFPMYIRLDDNVFVIKAKHFGISPIAFYFVYKTYCHICCRLLSDPVKYVALASRKVPLESLNHKTSGHLPSYRFQKASTVYLCCHLMK